MTTIFARPSHFGTKPQATRMYRCWSFLACMKVENLPKIHEFSAQSRTDISNQGFPVINPLFSFFWLEINRELPLISKYQKRKEISSTVTYTKSRDIICEMKKKYSKKTVVVKLKKTIEHYCALPRYLTTFWGFVTANIRGWKYG